MKSNLKSAIYGGFGFVFPIAISLFTTPYIVHKLTPEIYGIYVLATSLIGLMFFMDLGFGQGIIKFVSHYEAQKDYEKINKIVETSLVIYVVMGVTGAVIIYFSSNFIADKIFKLHFDKLVIGSLAFKIVAFGFFMSFISSLFSSIPKGLQKYDIAVKIQNFVWFMSILTSVLLLYLGKGLIEILISYSIFQFIGIFLYMGMSKKLLPTLRFRLRFDKSIFKEIFGFSIFVSLNVISANIVTRLDKMIVSYFLGTSAVSFYTIPYNLASMCSTLVGSTNQFLFPAISNLNSKGEKNKVRYYYIRSLDYTGLMSTFIMLIFIIFSDRFIYIWLGRNFAENSYHLSPILGFAFFFSCLTSVSLWYYTAMNKTHINLISSLTGSVSYLLASLLFIPIFGLKGAAFSFLFILVPFPFYNLYICKIIGIKVREYVTTILPYTSLVFLSLIYVLSIDERSLEKDLLVSIVLLISTFFYKKELFFELINKVITESKKYLTK